MVLGFRMARVGLVCRQRALIFIRTSRGVGGGGESAFMPIIEDLIRPYSHLPPFPQPP